MKTISENEQDTRNQANELGYAAGIEGKKAYDNPYEESTILYWLWLRGWVSAGLEKHCPSNTKDSK